MIKFFCVLALFFQITNMANAAPHRYSNEKAGFTVVATDTAINIVSQDFYNGLEKDGTFFYVSSLSEDDTTALIGDNYINEQFKEDYNTLKLLERSGIDPKKANLKAANPELYWPQDQPSIKPFINGTPFDLKTNTINGYKSLKMQFTQSETKDGKQNSYNSSIDIFPAHNRLYIVLQKTSQSTDGSETIIKNSTEPQRLKNLSITKPKKTQQKLVINDQVSDIKLELPDNWYYIQHYTNIDDNEVALNLALPLSTLPKLQEKTKNVDSNDLNKETVQKNISEEKAKLWTDIMKEMIWSFSYKDNKNQGFSDLLAYPEKTKKEITYLASTVQPYLENDAYYTNSTFKYSIDINSKACSIDFDLGFTFYNKVNFDTTGRIFFTNKKASIIGYTSTLTDKTQRTVNQKLINNIKSFKIN